MTEVVETVGEWYSLQEVAARLGVSIDTIRMLMGRRPTLMHEDGGAILAHAGRGARLSVFGAPIARTRM